MIKVYHATNTRETPWRRDEEALKLFLDNTNDEYSLAAEIMESHEPMMLSFDQRLENAFKLSNHINEFWDKNPDVEAFSAVQRSTSVGDIMVIGDRIFLVGVVGFERLK